MIYISLPYEATLLPCSAALSILTPPFLESVKNVPNLRPAMIFRTAFSAIPLQMTTDMPFSSAQQADRTLNIKKKRANHIHFKPGNLPKFPSKIYFGIHSAQSDPRLLSVLDADGVLRAVRVDESGTFLRRRTGVNAIHVRHEDQQIRLHFGRQTGGQTVVVLDADHLNKRQTI